MRFCTLPAHGMTISDSSKMAEWDLHFNGDEAEVWLDLFALRRDAYAVQMANGSYHKTDGELSEDVVWSHLFGDQTIGTYALNKDSCIWGALDADYGAALTDLQRLGFALQGVGLHPVLELSRRGGHLWVLCLVPVKAKNMRRIFLGVVNELGMTIKTPESEGIEVFPRQDSTESYGNLVRGPLGVHRKSGERYPIGNLMSLKPVGELSVTEQLSIWAWAPRSTPAEIEAAAAMYPDLTKPVLGTRLGAPLDISSLNIVQWAQQLTQLRTRGKDFEGLFPFHKDSKPSFHVYAGDPVKHHFHCFGCGAHGDAADLKAEATGRPLADILREMRIGG